MTKLFKNSKNALAFVLAFAVIAVSLFTGVAINANAACDKRDSTNIIYLDDNTYTNTDTSWKNEGDGSVDNPYIVSTVNQLRNVIAEFDFTNYAGKYFKIKDGIDIISLQSDYSLRKSYAQFNEGASDQDIDAAWNYFKSLDTADKVKDYFEKTNYKNKWWSGENFDAHFDFNGATIYGMYTASGALFSSVGATATIENIAIANSYVEGTEYAGAIVGHVFVKSTDAGTVKLQNFEIANTYIALKYAYAEGKVQEYSNRVGVVVGMSASSKLGFSFKDFLIYNCKAVFVNPLNDTVTDYTGLLARLDMPVQNETETSYYQVENGILLDCLPYDKYVNPTTGYSGSGHLSRKENYNNVYVNNELDPIPYYVLRSWDSINNYAGKIDVMSDVTTLSDVTKEMTSGLDYENAWIMTVNGPQLRALHGEFKATSNGADGHTLACEDCGLKTSTTSEPHDWSNKDGICKVCSDTCGSVESETVTVTEATCSAAKTVKNVCKVCGKTTKDTYSSGKPLGHKLNENLIKVEKAATCDENGIKLHYECKDCKKWFSDEKAKTEITETQKSTYTIAAKHDGELVVEKPATCTENGNSKYYRCKNEGCGKLFTDEACTTETTLDKVTIVAKGHEAQKDDDGIVYKAVDGKHYKVCTKCTDAEGNATLFEPEDCTCDEYTSNGDGTHSGICKVCGLKTQTKITHDCELEKVEKVDATTEKEGVQEHYKCEVCDGLYEDAEGKTPTTLEKLAIAKVEDKADDAAKDDSKNDNNNSDNNTNGTTTTTTTPTVNGDKNNESPKTGDNVALAVSAVVAVIAAGYVLVRKFVKA